MNTVAAAGENLKIDGSRLWESLMEMARLVLELPVAITDKHLPMRTQKVVHFLKPGAERQVAKWAWIKWAICLPIVLALIARLYQYM